MAIETLEAALFFDPALTPAATLPVAGSLITRTSSVEGYQLVPLDEEQQQMLTATDVSLFEENGKIVFLTNERMCREVDADWMLQLVLSDPDTPRHSVLSFTPVPSGGADAEPNWKFLVKVLPIVVATCKPTLAMLNGLSTDEEVDHLPSFEELVSGEFPPVVTPWMYIGPERLDEGLRKKLALLDVYLSEPLGEGWLLQIIENYADKPSSETVKLLRALRSKGIKYTQTR